MVFPLPPNVLMCYALHTSVCVCLFKLLSWHAVGSVLPLCGASSSALGFKGFGYLLGYMLP